MAAYKKLAESHTQVLKKVSEVESNIDQESNTQSSFSALLKIVEYSDSETSDSPQKVGACTFVAHPNAKPFDVHETLHKDDVTFSGSETDEEVEGVKCYVGKILEKSDMENTSADSKWESVKVMETDAYRSESQVYTSVESDTESHSEEEVEKTSDGELESDSDEEGDKLGDAEDSSDNEDREIVGNIEDEESSKSREDSSESENGDDSHQEEEPSKSTEDSHDCEISVDKPEEVEKSKSREDSSVSENGDDSHQEVEQSKSIEDSYDSEVSVDKPKEVGSSKSKEDSSESEVEKKSQIEEKPLEKEQNPHEKGDESGDIKSI